VFDFLTAVRPHTPSFADVWLEFYQARKLKGEALPELPEVVKMFRNHRRLVDTQTSESETNRAAFTASFQGKTPIGHDLTCLCGESHNYVDCAYLNPYIRPDGWTGDSALEQKIQDILKKSDEKKRHTSPFASTSTLYSSSRRTTASYPLLAAKCSAATPLLSFASTSALCSSSSRTTASCP
jgi:hypothetical protein